MNITSANHGNIPLSHSNIPFTATTQLAAGQPANLAAAGSALQALDETAQPDLRETFNRFVGQTFYGQMLSAMRQTVGRPAYFHGGHSEEVFQGQLDQLLSEKLSDASADSFTDPMFELFHLNRS